MKDYENYVFDLYGTLVDIHTEEEDSSVWKKLALFYGYYDANYAPDELKERYAALVAGEESERKAHKKDDVHEAYPEVSLERIFLKLFVEKGADADMTLAVHAGQFFRILTTDYVRLYDGVPKLLQELKKRGKKLYLLSNAQRIFTEYELHTLEIAGYFDDIFISSEYGVKKPDSHFFELLIEKHRLNRKKTLMIGNDALSDIAGAKAVGFDTLYIHSNISPKLKEEEYFTADGKKAKRMVMPEADYVMDEMDMERLIKLLEN